MLEYVSTGEGFEIRKAGVTLECGGVVLQSFRAAETTRPSEQKSDSARVVGGYATRYCRAHLFNGKIDVFAPGAFTKSLQDDDPVGLVEDHGSAVIVGNHGHGLELWEDECGLAFKAKLPSTDLGCRAFDLVNSRKKSAVSIAYYGVQSETKTIAGQSIRWITAARIHDITLCRKGAVAETYAEVLNGNEALVFSGNPVVANLMGAFARMQRIVSEVAKK